MFKGKMFKMTEEKREKSTFGEWLLRELEGYMDARKLSLKDVATQADLPYTTLWKSYKGERNLKDFEIERLLRFLGYRLSFEKREIRFQVCRVMKTECDEPLYEVPVCTKIHIDGTPDLRTKVDTFFFKEKVYALRVSDSRALPFAHRSFIVGYIPEKEISGEGFYILVDHQEPSIPILREVVLKGLQVFLKLYSPEDFEMVSEENYKVVGRVKHIIIQGL